MKKLLLTDDEAENLINIIKEIVEDHNVVLVEKTTGKITIKSKLGHLFTLHYRYTSDNKVFHFKENKYDYTLLRINLNESFHKNANGEKVYGNRINIFSEQEYYDKADGKTHYKCYPLPFENIKNSCDFLEILDNLFEHIHIENKERADIKIITSFI